MEKREEEKNTADNEEVRHHTGGCGWVGNVVTVSHHTHPRPPSAAASSSPDLVLFLVLQNGLQEGSTLTAWRLLVEHASLDDLLVHVQFVLGCCQDLLLHTVDSAEAEHAHLVLLTDTMGSVLSLQILRTNDWLIGLAGMIVNIETMVALLLLHNIDMVLVSYDMKSMKKSDISWDLCGCQHILSTWCGFQSLSKMMTVSADCRLRPRPPALVLSRNTKYSEAGSLNVFSSMPRSSALVVPMWKGMIRVLQSQS